MTGLAWFNSSNGCDYPTSFGGKFENSGGSAHGICVKRPELIEYVTGVYDKKQ